MVEPTSQDVEQTACLWAARLDDGPLPAADQTRLDAWLASDPRNLGAFARARAVAVHSRRAGGLAGGAPLRSLSSAPRGGLSRRALIAACVPAALGGAGAWALLRQSTVSFSTRRGETRVVPLEDGSVMTVNTLSAGVVRYGQSARTVMLKSGEALFNVVADIGRPFVVRSGDTTVVANGASFLVRRLADRPLQVVSVGGDVEIKGDVGRRLKLAANTQAMVHDGELPQNVGLVDVDRELAWRRGRIQLENETLSQAAQEFSRYNDTPIVMADSGVAGLRITGLFVANDPVAFAKAAAGSLNLKVDVNAQQIVLARA